MIFLGASPAVPDTGPRPEQQKVKVQMFSLTVVPSKASMLNDQQSRGDQVFRAVGTPKAPGGEPDGGHQQPRERPGNPASGPAATERPGSHLSGQGGSHLSGPATPRAVRQLSESPTRVDESPHRRQADSRGPRAARAAVITVPVCRGTWGVLLGTETPISRSGARWVGGG